MRITFPAPSSHHVQQLAEEIRDAVGEKPRTLYGGSLEGIVLIFERDLNETQQRDVKAIVTKHDGTARLTNDAIAQAQEHALRSTRIARRGVLTQRLLGGDVLSLLELNELLRLERS